MNPTLAFVIMGLLLVGAVVCAFLFLRERAQSALVASRLRRLEKQLDAAFHSALDGALLLDAQSRILQANAAAEKMLGIPNPKLIGMPLADMLLPTPFGKVSGKELIEYFLADKESRLGKPQEMTAMRANGGNFPVELVVEKVRSEGELSLVVHLRETTERVRAETALFERASLAALNSDISAALAKPDEARTVLQHCAEALVWHLDVALARIWTTSEESDALEIQADAGTGIPSDPADNRLSMKDSDFGRIAEGFRPFLTHSFADPKLDPKRAVWAKEQEVVSVAAYPLVTGGRMVGLLVLFDRKPLPEGLFTKVGAVAESVSQFVERSRAERHVREQAALLDKASDAILERDLSGKIRYWNKGAERLYGWPVEAALGRPANEVITVTDTIAHDKAEAQTLQSGEWIGELPLTNKAGQKLIVESRWTLVKGPDGSPRSILIISTDVTEKKQLEEKFLRAQRLEIVGTLAGGIAHDLNNLLGPIVNSSQLLRPKIADEKGLKWLSIMESNAMRGASMVKQILAFARGLESERGSFQLRHLVAEVERMAQETFPPSIHVESDVERDLWPIFGNASQVHQVVLNLCVNARDAMPNGGHLQLSARNVLFAEGAPDLPAELRPGRYIKLVATDTGTGIPPEILEKVFEPFFTTKDADKGTGLGLSTVMNIIKGHEGCLRVSSQVGVGTAFEIYLPAVRSDEVGGGEKLSLDKLSGKGERILLVDDEVAILEITKATLENCGYKVITARNGQEAFRLYAQERANIDAVIMDLMMPLMDGATAVRALRKVEPKVKVLAFSGTVGSKELAQIDGMDRVVFLAKPFSTEKLLEALRTTLVYGENR